MLEELPPKPTLITGSVSIARLHGEACFHCGAVHGPLYAGGHVTLPGKDCVWPIVTCGCRKGAAS